MSDTDIESLRSLLDNKSAVAVPIFQAPGGNALDISSNVRATMAELKAAMVELPALRVLAHGTNAGQSRAVRTGVLAARAPAWRAIRRRSSCAALESRRTKISLSPMPSEAPTAIQPRSGSMPKDAFPAITSPLSFRRILR